MTPDRVYNVLFLCTENSARSIMAECLLNRLGQGRFKAYSAGSHPKGEIHPYAEQVLKNENYSLAGLRSKSWTEFSADDAPIMDFVFTVCDDAANETCPVWPGAPMSAHWGVPDPASVTGTPAEERLAFAETMRFLNTRVSIFVNLPMVSIDRLALQKRLDEIGQDVAKAAI
jgi:protein-tyrosine-phosphatase